MGERAISSYKTGSWRIKMHKQEGLALEVDLFESNARAITKLASETENASLLSCPATLGMTAILTGRSVT